MYINDISIKHYCVLLSINAQENHYQTIYGNNIYPNFFYGLQIWAITSAK